MRLVRIIPYLVLLSELVLAGCGSATPAPTPFPNGQATIVVQGSPSQAQWLALTERLADDRSPLVQNSQLMPSPPQVLVGALPAALPFKLPLPDQAVIVGSVLRTGSPRGEGLILLDVPQPAASINTFFQAALAQQGFAPWVPGPAPSFQPTSSDLLFCQREQGIQLELTVYTAPGQPSDVRLSYTTNSLLVYCTDDPHPTTSAAEALLPSLSLPPHSVALGSGSGSDYTGWAYAQRDLLTPETIADLDDFFRPQLLAAGWLLSAQERSAPVAWSKWTLTDAHGVQWSGLLLITAGQGSQNSRMLLFQIEQAG